MGRQIGFYTTLKDDVHLAKVLREEFDCTILAWNMPTREPKRIGRLTPIKQGRNKQDQVILVPNELLSKLKIAVYGPAFCRINEGYSPVIVWSRCYSSPTGSHAGRFWYEPSKPGNKMKSKVFRDWADRVFRKVQQLFEKHPKLSRLRLIGPDFLAQLATGRLSIDVR